MENVKIIATNRKARHDFFLLESYEAGIVLQENVIEDVVFFALSSVNFGSHDPIDGPPVIGAGALAVVSRIF